MDIENKEMGLRIRSMREYQKLSREKLAEMSNVSTQFLADIENGKKGMSALTLKKICTALCVPADSIVFDRNLSENEKINEMLSSVPNDKKDDFEDIIIKMIRLL